MGPASQAPARLHQQHRDRRGRQPPRGGYAGGAPADHANVHFGRKTHPLVLASSPVARKADDTGGGRWQAAADLKELTL
jgi:hypothetical protein